MNALILVGGLGSRLKSEVPHIPKPMAPIGNKPFLELLMKRLNDHGFKKIILCTGYKSEFIRDHFSNNYRNMEITYSNEHKSLGTGGAIKLALDVIDRHQDLFIFNGDTFFEIDYSKFQIFHKENNFSLTIALKNMREFERYGSVNIDRNFKIDNFNEKEYKKEGLINTGIYLTTYETLEKLPKKEVFSFEDDFLNQNVKKLRFGGFVTNGFFIDIGIPEDYIKAKSILND